MKKQNKIKIIKRKEIFNKDKNNEKKGNKKKIKIILKKTN